MSLFIVPTLSGEDVTTHNYSLIFPIREVDYLFTFSFSETMGRWSLNIDSPQGDPIVAGAVVLNGVDLFTYADIAQRPRGVLICSWIADVESAKEPGEQDLGQSHVLWYYERVEDLGDGLPVVPGLA